MPERENRGLVAEVVRKCIGARARRTLLRARARSRLLVTPADEGGPADEVEVARDADRAADAPPALRREAAADEEVRAAPVVAVFDAELELADRHELAPLADRVELRDCGVDLAAADDLPAV